jgi:glycosyltransferase involved in cell wall biosynthesis
MFRVIEGILQSDMTTILSEAMLEKLKEQTKELTGQNIIGHNNVIVFEPSVSSVEISKYSSSARIFDLDKVVITFPGRLSIGEEQRTNWDKFLKAIGLLRYKRQDFEVYLTDPNNGMPSKLEQGLYQENFVHTIPADRDSFLKLLNRTDIVVSLMDVEGFGGISIREALLMNCMPIIPEVHEYINMAPDDYEFFVDSPIDVDDLENALNYAIIAIQVARRRIGKTGGVLQRRFDYVEYGKKFSIEEQFKKLLPFIGGI